MYMSFPAASKSALEGQIEEDSSMGTFLAENFWGIGAIGCLSAILLLIAMVQTGKFAWLLAAIGTIVITLLLMVHEVTTVTVREEIASVLFTIATDLETNDPARMLRHVSASALDLQQHVRKLAPLVSIHRATVKSNLTVQPDKPQMPSQSTARFNAVLVLSEKRSGLQNQLCPFLFVVDFVREEGEWKVIRYQRHDPRGEAFDNERR